HGVAQRGGRGGEGAPLDDGAQDEQEPWCQHSAIVQVPDRSASTGGSRPAPQTRHGRSSAGSHAAGRPPVGSSGESTGRNFAPLLQSAELSYRNRQPSIS